jgi:predicted MFS family arabinose efflux permease
MNPQERRSVGALALLYCFRMLGLFMVLPLLALYAADLPGATPSRIGLALGIYGLAQALLQVPLGWLSDRVGRKPVIIGGLLMFALGSVIAAMADSLEGIILGRALQGAGAIASTIMAMVADLTREEQRTKAMAVVGVSIGFSFTLALVLGPVVASFGDLSAVFWFTALLALLGVAIVYGLVPTPSEVASTARVASLWSALGHPLLLRLNYGVFVLHFVLTASFLVVPGLLEQSLGIHRGEHWMVYLPVLLLSLLGMIPLMILAERGGRLRLAFLLAIGAVIAAVAALDILSVSPAVYVALWLFFVGFNYLEATLPSLLSKSVAADNKGAAMGVYSTCQFLGAFAGGAGGGWLLQHAGVAMLVGACLLLAVGWWLLVLRAPASVAAGEMEPGVLPGV